MKNKISLMCLYLFKFSTNSFNLRYYRFVHAIAFATREINDIPDLLPNVTLGFKIYDSCYSEVRAIMGTMSLLTGLGEPVANYRCGLSSLLPAIIGDSPSASSVPMARLLGVYKYPQISYGSTVNLLSDKQQFPSFLRTAPNSDFQAVVITYLLTYFKWTWIGILASDNEFGREGSQQVIKEVRATGACIDFMEILPAHNSVSKLLQITEIIKASEANVIVIYATQQYPLPLMKELSMQNVSGKVWIALSSWIISPVFSNKEIIKTLNGTIGFESHQGGIPGYRDYLYSLHPSKFIDDIFIKLFWETAFNCKWPLDDIDTTSLNESVKAGKSICTGKEKVETIDVALFDVYSFRKTYCTYNAVYALVHGLHNLLMCRPGDGPFQNKTCAVIYHFQPWQLLHYVRNVHFINTDNEEIYFDSNGDPPAVYDILNWQAFPDGSSQYVQVGLFDSKAPKEQKIIINVSAILWNHGERQAPASVCSNSCLPGYRKAAQRGKAICCFDCVPCSKGEITNQSDASSCTLCSEEEWSNEKHNKCFPKSKEVLSYEDPLGAALAAVTVVCAIMTAITLCIFIKYRETPIVKANNRGLSYFLLVAIMLCFLCSLIFLGYPVRISCMLRQTAFGIIFSMCISCILAKTFTVVIAFSATHPNSHLRKWLGSGTPNFIIIIICILIQVMICLAWLISSPPFPEVNMKSSNEKIVIGCNEGSIVAFYALLGYLGLLASVSFVTAFIARRLPGTFNEAKCITFSMLVFVSVWLSFIPAYLSTQGKYMVAVEIFAILSSSAGLLGSIFFPKCFIILLQPQKNTKEYLKGKEKPRT
ncbi:extracellular calcium-sensing receptor-like [Protopterus annectens]|uniref:extracellular calcium-sensing receptor-like n=1 Tax=Protopterus annectens TaxID=7888 RepID=UPI001CFA7283|nr:extracellular calcium-sensing receptor-like [Protopterus annectens]